MLENYFFDFDKTLASSGKASLIATKQAFKLNNLDEPDDDQILDFMGIPADVSFPKMANRELSESDAKKLVDTYRNIYGKYEKENTHLYPGMRDVLDDLQQKGKNLFVVSSKSHDILKRNLDNLKITQYFKDFVGCDEVQHYKPAPDGILILLDRYNLNNKQSVMVGDARYDLQMGKSASVKTCGAAWDAFSVDSLKNEHPDYLLFHVAELKNIE